MLKLRLPTSDLSCPLGHTCEKCLLYVQMPVDVTDPTTGKVIPSTEFDCAYIWSMLGSWDAGRQSQGVHAAVAHQTKEATKRQDALLTMVAGGPRPSDADTHSALPSDPPESLPSPQARP